MRRFQVTHSLDLHNVQHKATAGRDLQLMPSFVDLHQALRARNFVVVEQVVTSGIDINAPLRGTTPLSLAIYLGLEDAVKLLLSHGANVNQLSRDHLDRLEPPLYTACRLGMSNVARMLLAARADANRPDWYGQTPLWVAVRERRLDLVRLLLDNGARLADVHTWSECPLFLATKYLHFGRRDIAVLLTRSGCNPNLTDGNHRNALFWALKYGDKELAVLLVMAGARPHVAWDRLHIAPELCQDRNFCTWLNHEKQSPWPLKRICRLALRRHVVSMHPGSVSNTIDALPLPASLKSYLNLDPP